MHAGWGLSAAARNTAFFSVHMDPAIHRLSAPGQAEVSVHARDSCHAISRLGHAGRGRRRRNKKRGILIGLVVKPGRGGDVCRVTTPTRRRRRMRLSLVPRHPLVLVARIRAVLSFDFITLFLSPPNLPSPIPSLPRFCLPVPRRMSLASWPCVNVCAGRPTRQLVAEVEPCLLAEAACCCITYMLYVIPTQCGEMKEKKKKGESGGGRRGEASVPNNKRARSNQSPSRHGCAASPLIGGGKCPAAEEANKLNTGPGRPWP